jgi:hypothetical protein
MQNALILTDYMIPYLGETIESSHLKFNETTVLPLEITTDTWESVMFSIDKDALQRGVFVGWFAIRGESNNSVPVTITTPPMLFPAILLIISLQETTLAMKIYRDKILRKNKYAVILPSIVEKLVEQCVYLKTTS